MNLEWIPYHKEDQNKTIKGLVFLKEVEEVQVKVTKKGGGILKMMNSTDQKHS